MLSKKTAQGIVKEWVHSTLIDPTAVQSLRDRIYSLSFPEQALVCAEGAKFVSQLSTHVTKVTLSSAKQDWLTPPYFLDIVRRFGPIVLDPCANPSSFVNAVHSFYGPPNHICGLSNSWLVPEHTVCFVNPPYGRSLTLWAMKMASEYEAPREACGSLIALIPARVGTGYWERYLWPFVDAVCFWNGGTKYPSRMRFYELGGQQAELGATFDAAVVYFGSNRDKFKSVFEPFGKIQLCN